MMVSPVVFVTMISMTEAANGKTFHSSPHQTDCELGRFVPHQEPMKTEEHSVIVFCFYPFFGRKCFQRNLRHGFPLDSYLMAWFETNDKRTLFEVKECVEWKWTWRYMTARESSSLTLTSRILEFSLEFSSPSWLVLWRDQSQTWQTFSRPIFNQPQERHINKDPVQQTNPNPNQTTQNVQ